MSSNLLWVVLCGGIACVLGFGLSSVSRADTIYVASDGNDAAAGTEQAPLKTVQAGLAKANPGDTVFLKAGTYLERVSFPRDGAEGKIITLTGDNGAILDGGTRVTGWERVAGGGNIWKTAYTGPTVRNMTWNGKYILRISDDRMTSEGMDILKDGPKCSDLSSGTTNEYRSWDGISAMFGTDKDSLYIGFGDATVDPAKDEFTIAPYHRDGGAVVTMDGRRFVTVRGLTIRNGYNAVCVRNKSSDCVIENNLLIGGRHTIDIITGSSRIIVRRNEITLNYVYPLEADNPRHWFIWNAFKRNSDTDRVCVEVQGVGSDNEVCYNYMHDNFDGVENQDEGQRLNVHHNLIERMSDEGLEPDGEETGSQWHDNVVLRCNIAYRHKRVVTNGEPMYVYRNLFYAMPGKSTMGQGIYFFTGTTATAYIYQNTFAVTRGFTFGGTKPEIGLGNTWLVNNVFSCETAFNENKDYKVLPHFENNYFSGNDRDKLPAWFDESNKFVKGGELWKRESKPDFKLAAASAARGIGIDLSKSWTAGEKTLPALIGMEPGYFTGKAPDAGAIQYRGSSQQGVSQEAEPAAQ